MRHIAGVCLALTLSLEAAGVSAKSLYQEGRKAERDGDTVRAYLLYAEAAAMEPNRVEYWQRAEALRTRASLKAKPHPVLTAADRRLAHSTQPPAGEGFSTTITADDLEEVRRLRPPPTLKATPGRKTLDLRGNFKQAFDETAKAFGLDTIYDSDYEGGRRLRLHLEDVDYRDALQAVQAATGSFVLPLGERLILVAKDTVQKRAEVEPTVAISIPIPDPVTPQEAQEMARAIQQTMEIQKLSVDADRQMVLIRDRISKVRPAQLLFEQLAHGKPQVDLQLQFAEVTESSFLSYGFLMPSSFPITWIGQAGGKTGQLVALGKVFFGHTLLGLGIANAGVFATMNRSTSKNLLQLDVRSSDGQPASFHVGQRYPILTGGFLGTSRLGVPPSFNFEDLGLTLKVTPKVHGMEEVSLDVNAEFKVLSGQSLNGVPVISNRSLESKLRLRSGEWAILAGLMTNTEARSVSGLAGLSQLPVLGPLFRQNDRNSDTSYVLLLLKPQLLTLPPGEFLTRTLHVGTEGRLSIPL